MKKKAELIIEIILLLIIASAICSCKTQRTVTDNYYQDTVKMSKDECKFLNKGKKELKEMKHLTKRVCVRK